jgi:dipeptidyl aminopeptidase/acylaminoacyl peptidase
MWCPQGSAGQQPVRPARSKRPFQVADSIQMTELADPAYNDDSSSAAHVAQFSPDQRRFVIVLKRGNLDDDTNDYSILLFQTADVLHTATPEIIATFSSSSPRPGVQQVRWLNNKEISFLGERRGRHQQLYRLAVDSRRLIRVTNHATSLTSYCIRPGDGRVLFIAEKQAHSLTPKRPRSPGIVVATQFVTDLIEDNDRYGNLYQRELFTVKEGSRRERRMPIRYPVFGSSGLWLSPNGRYLIVEVLVPDPPPLWEGYTDWSFKMLLSRNRSRGARELVVSLVLVDTTTEESRFLLNAPASVLAPVDVVWSADSGSVVVGGTYLPLDVSNPLDREHRQSTTFLAEVSVPGGGVTPITEGGPRLLNWDFTTHRLVLQSATRASTAELRGGMLAYEKREGTWTRCDITEVEKGAGDPIDVAVEEDLDNRPRIYAIDHKHGVKSLLLDLNPQFEDLEVANVEDVTFTGSDGQAVRGGLYRPAGYMPGKRYPLVIQTHGWNPQRFWVDGPYSTAFAAQPLASRGFAVLQLEEKLTDLSTPQEAPRETAAYEGAIDYLDRIGLIDRTRVGIVGFSRTGLSVKYALTKSKYNFTAAVIADGNDSGYFQYLAFANAFPFWAEDAERASGTRPFGAGLATWFQYSPNFHLDDVRTPIRIEALSQSALLMNWEWFAGLSLLHKSVELIYVPGASHVLVQPWQRMMSQGGTVDWFSYWLKGEEDPDPSKAEQYLRWREFKHAAEYGAH